MTSIDHMHAHFTCTCMHHWHLITIATTEYASIPYFSGRQYPKQKAERIIIMGKIGNEMGLK